MLRVRRWRVEIINKVMKKQYRRKKEKEREREKKSRIKMR